MLLEVTVFLVFLTILWRRWCSLPSDFPPTPPLRLPVIGHIHYLLFNGGSHDNPIERLYRKYGDERGMVAFQVGSLWTVYIGDFHLLKEAAKKEELNFRMARDVGIKRVNRVMGTVDNAGIIFAWEDTWQEQRRFLLSTLRDFGFGKSGMEDVIRQEADLFAFHLKNTVEKEGHSVEISNHFNICIVNCIWKLVAGKRFDYDDEELIKLTTLTNETMTSLEFRKDWLIIVFPWLEKVFKSSRLDAAHRTMRRMKDFLRTIIEEHRAEFDSGSLTDFIDAYIEKVDESNGDGSSFDNGLAQLEQVLVELFFAGSETTSSTLTWAILFLVLHPDIQNRVRQETLDIVGRSEVPRLCHKKDMPFTEATIMEIQRCGNIAPNALPHATTTQSVKIGGFTIPRNSSVTFYLSNLMNSKKYWTDPKRFDPKRHLVESAGQSDGLVSVIRSDHLTPFGMGKRQCPGEGLARAEIFIMLATLVQRFEFEPDTDDPTCLPSPQDYVQGITRVPKPFRVRIKPCW